MGIESRSYGWKEFVRRRRNPHVREQGRINRSRQGQGIDVPGAGFTQELGAFIQCGAGRKHIIYQKNPARSDRIGPANMKGAPEIGQTDRAGERSLGRIVAGPDQIGIGKRDLQSTGNRLGQEQGLIEFPLSESGRMERDRHDEVRFQLRRQGGRQQAA
jgi:hypothetical protein